MCDIDGIVSHSILTRDRTRNMKPSSNLQEPARQFNGMKKVIKARVIDTQSLHHAVKGLMIQNGQNIPHMNQRIRMPFWTRKEVNAGLA
jgi:hypothetical protein